MSRHNSRTNGKAESDANTAETLLRKANETHTDSHLNLQHTSLLSETNETLNQNNTAGSAGLMMLRIQTGNKQAGDESGGKASFNSQRNITLKQAKCVEFSNHHCFTDKIPPFGDGWSIRGEQQQQHSGLWLIHTAGKDDKRERY